MSNTIVENITGSIKIAAFTAVAFAITAVSAQAMTQAEQMQHMQSQLRTASEKLAAMRPAGSVLGATSTASTVVPVRPVCRITFDKPSYKLGDKIKVSWVTTGTKSAEFVADESGKDTLPLPIGTTLAIKGSATVSATVTGSPAVFMKVTSSTGNEMTCGRRITIVDEAAGKKDSRIAQLQTKLANLVSQENKMREQAEKIEEKIAANLITALETQIKIEQLMNATNTPKTGGKPVVAADSFESSDTTSGENGTLVTYTMEFEVMANDTVVYIPKTAARTGASTATAGVAFQITTGTGSSSAAKGVVSATLTSTADEESGYYEVGEGETETFTATISFDPNITGQYRAELIRINWTNTMTSNPVGSVTAGTLKALKFTPAEDFRSDYAAVNAS